MAAMRHSRRRPRSSALNTNGAGSFNIASGTNALLRNTIGHDNVATGMKALLANKTGSGNIGLGSSAGSKLTTGSNNVDIANVGVAGESGAIRIGTSGEQTAAFLQGVSGISIQGPTQVVRVSAAGQLGTATATAASAGGGAPARPASEREVSRLRGEVDALRREVGRLRATNRAG